MGIDVVIKVQAGGEGFPEVWGLFGALTAVVDSGTYTGQNSIELNIYTHKTCVYI